MPVNHTSHPLETEDDKALTHADTEQPDTKQTAAGQTDTDRFALQLATFIAHDIDLQRVAGAFPAIDTAKRDWMSDLAKVVAVRVTAALPKTSEADKLVGPFYRAADLARWRGVTRQAISKQARQRRVLALISASGTPVYPAWQFGPKGEPLPALAEVLTAIDRDGLDALGSAIWLNRPATRFDGQTPAAMLRAGHKAEVLTAARQISSANAA